MRARSESPRRIVTVDAPPWPSRSEVTTCDRPTGVCVVDAPVDLLSTTSSSWLPDVLPWRAVRLRFCRRARMTTTAVRMQRRMTTTTPTMRPTVPPVPSWENTDVPPLATISDADGVTLAVSDGLRVCDMDAESVAVAEDVGDGWGVVDSEAVTEAVSVMDGDKLTDALEPFDRDFVTEVLFVEVLLMVGVMEFDAVTSRRGPRGLASAHTATLTPSSVRGSAPETRRRSSVGGAASTETTPNQYRGKMHVQCSGVPSAALHCTASMRSGCQTICGRACGCG